MAMYKHSFYLNLNNTDAFMALVKQEGRVYRQVKQRKTIRFEQNNQIYFAKIYWGIGWWEIIKNLLHAQKPVLDAKQEEYAILRLKAAGINVPEVIACDRRRINPAKRQSYIVLEAIEPNISLEEYVLDWQNKPLVLRRQLIRQVAEMARKMHAAGVNHRDFYICHFLLNLQNSTLTLIDLHRAQCRNKVPYRWLVKDLAALYFSLLGTTLSSRDYLRFVKIYSGQSLRQSLQNPLWLAVHKKAIRLYRKIHSADPAVLQKVKALASHVQPILPTQLHLAERKELLLLQKSLRWLPRRRATFLGEWRNKPAIIKIFLHPWKGQWHLQQEIRGLQLLLQNHFACPEILYQGKSEQGYPVLIMHYIDNTQALSDWLENHDHIFKVLELLALQHQQGIWQADLHLNNFLLKDNIIYSLDAAKMHDDKHPVSQRRGLQQLALFCAQLPSLSRQHLEELLQYYAKQRNWNINKELNNKFIRIYHRIQRWRQRKFLLKIFRNCSTYQVKQNFHKRVILRRDIISPEFNLLLSDPASTFTRKDVQILKNGRASCVAKLIIAGQPILLKHYRPRNRWQGFTRLWHPSRAARCWYNTHLLEMQGVATPKPLAIIEKRWGWLRRDSYIIMQGDQQKVPCREDFHVNIP